MSEATNTTGRDTNQQILDSATLLMQRCGYNAFSYADIAEEVGIRKASIHYYYPSKSDLAQNVVERYRAASLNGLAMVEQIFPDPLDQLVNYITYYEREFFGQPRMCLCALLAAEMPTLPEQVRTEVAKFYGEHEAWLAARIAAGQADGRLSDVETPETIAAVLLAGLEGAMLAARAHDDVQRFRVIGRSLLRRYGVLS